MNMDFLIVAATKSEVNFLSKRFNFEIQEGNYTSFKVNNSNFDLLISGIGIHSTTYHLTKLLQKKKYKMVLNIGIAGCFKNFKVGDVVNVVQDEFADLGIEGEDHFSTLFEQGYMRTSEFPFIDGKLFSDFIEFCDTISSLPEATGITVNSVNGSKESIEKKKEKFNANIETMEGAAVLYVCLCENVHCTQIRAISNMVEPRDTTKWDISLALTNLENVMTGMFEEICGK